MTIFEFELAEGGYKWMSFKVIADNEEEAKELIAEYIGKEWVQPDGEFNYYAESFYLIDDDGKIDRKGLYKRLKLKGSKPVAKGVMFEDYTEA